MSEHSIVDIDFEHFKNSHEMQETYNTQIAYLICFGYIIHIIIYIVFITQELNRLC